MINTTLKQGTEPCIAPEMFMRLLHHVLKSSVVYKIMNVIISSFPKRR